MLFMHSNWRHSSNIRSRIEYSIQIFNIIVLFVTLIWRNYLISLTGFNTIWYAIFIIRQNGLLFGPSCKLLIKSCGYPTENNTVRQQSISAAARNSCFESYQSIPMITQVIFISMKIVTLSCLNDVWSIVFCLSAKLLLQCVIVLDL